MNAPTSPVDLAVVGHTNTGKTSLLRTLLRDETFGAIEDRPGTTRHVESAQLLRDDGTPLLTLRDTPGLEDAMGVLDYMDQLVRPGEHPDGPERIRRVLQGPESKGRFEQECRVLRTVCAVDAALYVVDVRDPWLPKHRDELALLTACGRPVLPVLNFTENPQARTGLWQEALARLGLHVCVEFDTVSPALDGPGRLLERLALLLDRHAAALHALRTDLEAQRQQRLKDAVRLVAELLMDVAALRLSCAPTPAAQAAATGQLRKRTRDREQACVRALLKRYQFNPAVFSRHALPLEGERWGMDLFNPQALKTFGVHLGKGVATGAMAGATLDILTGGLSLGAASLLGAAAGGAWQGANQWGRRVAGRLTGRQEITVDDAVLQLLGLRQLALIRALERRGHAAVQGLSDDLHAYAGRLRPLPDGRPTTTAGPHPDPAASDTGTAASAPAHRLPKAANRIIGRARGQPAWSSIGDAPELDAEREDCVIDMAHALLSEL